jgi:hypothetical protein
MSFVLPDPFPPPWASEWEEDAEWGLAATLNLNGVKQTFRWIQPGLSDGLAGGGEAESKRNPARSHPHRGYWLADTACTRPCGRR